MTEQISPEVKQTDKNRLSHHFQPGNHLSPGRPKGSKHERTLLQEAIKTVETDPRTICNCQIILGVYRTDIPRCKTVREHFLRRGLVNDQVITAVVKKLEPDLTFEQGERPPTTLIVNRIYVERSA